MNPSMNGYTDEQKKIISTVDDFAEKIKDRLLEKHKEGFRGWDKGPVSAGDIPERLYMKASDVYDNLFIEDSFVQTKTLVDIAALAMFLWNKRGKRTEVTP